MSFKSNEPLKLNYLFQELKKQLLPVCVNAQQANTEATLLMEFALEVDPQLLYTQPDRDVLSEGLIKIEALLHDRIQRRIPIQYLIHRAWFFGLPLYVNPHVLIPRPETELLAEVGIEWIKKQPVQETPFQVLDFGTGSGAIALAMAKELDSKAQVSVLDLSEEALDVAKLNAKKLKLPIHFLSAGDGFKTLRAQNKKFDVIISNPPYIDRVLEKTLEPEVLWHEPGLALFPPGDDSYYFYRKLAAESPRFLNLQGALLVEVGEGQAELVTHLFEEAGFNDIIVLPDYAGIARVVSGIKN
jgi:release factor glutamine methyltransferase